MGLVETLRLLEKQSASLADTLGGSSADSAKAEKGIEAVDQKTRQAVVSTADLHKGLEQLRGVLGGVSDFLSSSTAAASEYNSVIAQIATLGPEAAAGTAQWKTEILEVSAAMGQDATTAANAVYDALSSGVPPDNVISFMEVASKAAVAGATDTGTAVKALSATMNAWKLDASEAGQVSDVFFTGVNAGVFRFEELASGIGQVAPLAASLGVTYQEVTAATATLTKSGLSASQAITQQRASMISLLTPNAQMNTVLGELAEKNADVKRTAEEQGISIAEAALKTMGYQGTLIAVADAADSAGVGLAQAMGSSEALGAVLGMTGENAAGAAADLQMMRESGGATDSAFQQMSETYEMASKKLSAQFNAAMIEVGTTMGQLLVPLIQRGTEVLMSMLEGWRGLDDGTKKALVTIAAVVGLVGSGIGVFLSMQAAVAAIGPLFGTAGIGVTGFSAALAATGIGAAALAIGLLVKGLHDSGAAFDAANAEAVKAGGGYDAFAAAADRAGQKMGTLGKIGAVLSWGVGDTGKVREATSAWLEYGLGTDQAVLSSSRFQQEELKLSQQLTAGAISTDEYRASLLELANALGVAGGYGYVLSEAQQSQATALAMATSAALDKAGAVGEALAKDAEWGRTNDDLSAKVARGEMTLQQYRIAMDAYTASRAAQIEADTKAGEATAQAAGKLQAYSSEFAKLSGAGSQWTADTQVMAQAVEESWNGLSGGVEKNLTEQYASYQKYQEDLAAAREADAAAAAAAGQKRSESEAAHGQKMIELNARMEDAKTEKQRASAEKAIAKENEKLQGILSATESVGGANVAKVQAQYQEQVAIQQEALAQMVVDHVTNMVLMGQTSEETAKTIFATLRTAYPGVEVFSPVADAHVHLMATIRDATDESSNSQVQSIAKLPEAMNGALGEIQTTAAEHNATVDSWATADEILAGRTEEAGARVGAASGAAAEAVGASGSQAQASYDQTGEVALAHAGTTEEAGARVGAAAATEADDLSAHHGRERASYDETGLAAGTYATKIGQESQRAATGVQTGAEGMKSGLQGVQRELDATSLKGAALAGNVTRNLGGLGAGIETSAKRGKAALSDLDQQLIRTSETSVRVGSAGEEGFGAGADAAEDAAGGITDATTDIGKGAEDATEMIVLLRKGLEELPPEIELLFSGIGLDDLIGDVRRLRLELDAMARAFGNAGNAAGSSRGSKPVGKGGAVIDPGGGGGGGGGSDPQDSLLPPFDPWTDFWGEQQDSLAELAREAGRSLEVPAAIDDRTGGLFQDTGGRIALQDYLDALVGADYPVVVTPVLDEDTIIGQIDAARDEAERLLSVLQAQYDTFMRGGTAEEGSLAWLLANWQEIDQPADFAAMMTAMNVPVSTIQEFRAHWDALDPAGRAELWKRLYDDLRQMEKDRHDQAIANIDDEITVQIESMVNGQKVAETLTKRQLQTKIDEIEALIKSWEGMDDKGNETEAAKAILAGLEAKMMAAKLAADLSKEAENARHEQVMAGLEAENKLIGRQFDDWKAGIKAVADMEKQREEARKAFAKSIRDEQKETEEAEKGGHSLALQMLEDLKAAEEEKHDARMKWLDLERENEDGRYKAQIDAIKQLQADEDEAHERRMAALDDEMKRARGPLDKLDAAMLQLKIDMAELKLDTSSLEHAKSMLDGLKAALSNLPDQPDRRRNPTGQVAMDEQARAALRDALASGKLSKEDARRAERVLGGQRLGLEQMRALLERTADLNQETVSQEQSKLDVKQREIDMLQLQMDKEKLRYDQEALRIKALQDEENKLHEAESKRLGAREQAEKDRHDRAVADIKAREDAEKAAWDAFEKRLDTARRAEDQRHQAKMRQIEAEFRARLIAEGLIEEAGKDPEEALRRAQEIADKIFGALKDLVGSGSDKPPAEPAAPAPPAMAQDPNPQGRKGQSHPPPPIPIPSDPPRQVKRPLGVGGIIDDLAVITSAAQGIQAWAQRGSVPPPVGVTDDTAPALLEFEGAVDSVTMSLLELNAMMRAGSSSGDALLPGSVAGTGPTTYNSVANFYAPVIIPDDEDEALLLRQSLGAWGHRP